MKLTTNTTCRLDGVDDEWDVESLDYADELKDAIETVRDDHDEEVIVQAESIWIHRVHWNENTDSVWVGTYGYNRGMTIKEDE